ncbi:MAG TPA: right-handed parallel beta-helix repeat-containing protein, partial [Methanocella sp.]|nr:right-handed parallel beta-helix repeat-containing protein [Methanocella sp.]
GQAWPAHVLGNFWSDYRSTDANGNGLGDAVYRSNGITDSYPLIAAIASFTVGGSGTPTAAPTVSPTGRPTTTPTGQPTVSPTTRPSITPTPAPTVSPTARPTATPTPSTGAIQIDPTVPSNAVHVASQADINGLASGANAVLTADVSSLTLSKAVSLFGNGHKVSSITLAASGVRVSGVAANAIAVSAGGTTVDHCTVTQTGSYGIRVTKTDSVRILSNTVNGPRSSTSFGIYATNTTNVVIDGNTVTAAYMGIDLYGASNPRVSYNYIGNVAGFRQGIDIYAESVSGGDFANNEIMYSPYDGTGAAQDWDGMGFRYLEGTTIENNKIGGHYYALKVYLSNNVLIQGNNLYQVGSLRTGFYDSNLVVRNNKVSGQLGTQSVGLYINDGIYNSRYENNEVWNCNYGVQVSHYPTGTRYLEGRPGTPCSYIYLTNNYFHDNKVALGIGDKGATIESGNTFSNNGVIRNMY